MVEFLRHALPFHVAQELDPNSGKEDFCTTFRQLVRAFLMTDIHARQVGLQSSGAAVAVCLVQPLVRSHFASLLQMLEIVA